VTVKPGRRAHLRRLRGRERAGRAPRPVAPDVAPDAPGSIAAIYRAIYRAAIYRAAIYRAAIYRAASVPVRTAGRLTQCCLRMCS
jgi:hypothetical protein